MKWKTAWPRKGSDGRMRHLANGIALAFQFFSAIPVKKELPMEKKDITAMYMALPLLGLFFGGAAAVMALVFRDFTELSSLIAAFFITVLFAALTGGLHLDGLADAGDAYFSYQHREKRLEIMADPRIGAFGTMVLLFAVIGKILIISEVIYHVSLTAVLFIPFLSRTGLLLLFSTLGSAKKDGLAFFFQNKANKKSLIAVSFIYIAIVLVVLVIVCGWQLAFVQFIAFAVSIGLYRNWCKRHFGGVTGDLFGAYLEGVEWLLWAILLFFI
ncbi:adenosylcobinamide-GDP ribazoletransferase [Planococcus massiliensis]|nr:adenosylcobinamide-GDP ribazoletransferase [Planococcus massiliensis]